MRFCKDCGSYLVNTERGSWCPKCKNLVKSRTKIQSIKPVAQGQAIYIINDLREEYAKIPKKCPKCRNSEAFHWFTNISGEHAGVRRERTIEHFRCTRCSHSWRRIS